MPGLLHHNAMPEDREQHAPNHRTSTRRAGGASASAPPARGGEWTKPGGPFARCAGCDAPGRPQTCLVATHPQKKPGAAQCPRCEHAWEDIPGGGKRCSRCVLVVYPQRSLF